MSGEFVQQRLSHNLSKAFQISKTITFGVCLVSIVSLILWLMIVGISSGSRGGKTILFVNQQDVSVEVIENFLVYVIWYMTYINMHFKVSMIEY